MLNCITSKKITPKNCYWIEHFFSHSRLRSCKLQFTFLKKTQWEHIRLQNVCNFIISFKYFHYIILCIVFYGMDMNRVGLFSDDIENFMWGTFAYIVCLINWILHKLVYPFNEITWQTIFLFLIYSVNLIIIFSTISHKRI